MKLGFLVIAALLLTNCAVYQNIEARKQTEIANANAYQGMKQCNLMPITPKAVMAYDACFAENTKSLSYMSSDPQFSANVSTWLAERHEAAIQYSEGHISKLEYGSRLDQAAAKMQMDNEQHKLMVKQAQPRTIYVNRTIEQSQHCTGMAMGGGMTSIDCN